MRPWALHMVGEPPVRLVVTPGRVFHIGRDTEADLCLDDRLVSRRHVDLQVTETGALEATDLGSRNGTKVNGRALQGTVALVPGDELKIGAAVLVIDGVQKSDAPLPARARAFVRTGGPATPPPSPSTGQGPVGTLASKAPPGANPTQVFQKEKIRTNDELAIPTFSEEPGSMPPPPPLEIMPAGRDRHPSAAGGGSSHPSQSTQHALGERGQVPGYDLVSQVARGRTGVVWRARKLGPHGGDRLVKVLDPTGASRENALDRFETEAKAIAGLDHPNLIKVLDVSSANGIHYYATEAVDGQPLEEHLREGVLEPRDAIVIAVQVARGLAVAHASGVIHRDIAPASVIVTPDMVVKLFDFAFMLPPEEAPSLTEIGDVVGDVKYCAPEQAANPRSIDARADQYALGATIYHAIAGRPPFEGKNYLDTYKKLINEAPKPLQEIVGDVRPKLAQIVARLLEKEPEKRYASAGELALALSEAALEAVIAGRTFVPPPGQGIGADFRGVELLEVLQVLATRRATGHLLVFSTGDDGIEGEIVLRGGEIVAARSLDTAEMVAAADQMLDVRLGNFIFRSDPAVKDDGGKPLVASEIALKALRRRK